MPTTITIQTATAHEIVRAAVGYRSHDVTPTTINKFVAEYPSHVNTQLANVYAKSEVSVHWDGNMGVYTASYATEDSPSERADYERMLRNEACMYGIYIPGARERGSRSILEAVAYLRQIEGA